MSELSIKMFTKRETRARKANRVRCEATFVGNNSIFCGTLSDVRC